MTGDPEVMGADSQSGRRRRAFAGLRPPPKLQARISRVQLSQRLSDARMQEKVLKGIK